MKKLEDRTYEFALRVIKLTKALPNDRETNHIANQLFRSATSVAANYRASRRGKSKKDFIAKLGIVLEEADESHFWLTLIIDTNLLPQEKVAPLQQEASELTAIFTTSLNTAKGNP
ncbi:four helix bundle protein [Rubritalea tangerina]|uniref:Four helix bundle protein n=1 Tax=Rubritalea tangerina TaxID=430798 RepID=A0ABW4Z6E2_9BACT